MVTAPGSTQAASRRIHCFGRRRQAQIRIAVIAARFTKAKEKFALIDIPAQTEETAQAAIGEAFFRSEYTIAHIRNPRARLYPRAATR